MQITALSHARPQDFCAAGAEFTESMIEINPRVSLKLYRYTPKQPTQNPTVVFVAGWISRIQGWGEVLQEMSKDFPVIYIETRDKISSTVHRKAPMGVTDVGADVVEIVRREGFKDGDYILLGSSLGATALLETANDYRPLPKALVLIAPNADFRTPWLWRQVISGFWPPLYFIIRPTIKWYLRHFRMQVDADRVQYDKYCMALDAADPHKLKRAAKTFWTYSVWDKLSSIKLPTLIYSASTDKLHEPQNTARMLELMPDAKHIDMETNGATHSAAMVQELRRYLEELT